MLASRSISLWTLSWSSLMSWTRYTVDMCRMLAKVSCGETPAEYELLTASHSLSAQSIRARVPTSPTARGPHNDGCGAAWLAGDSLMIETRGRSACWNASFIDRMETLRTSALIAHNRAASHGLVVNTSAAHPYAGKIGEESVAFCHNGSVQSLFPEAHARRVTDSFLFLEHLSQRIHVLDLSSLRGLLRRCSNDWSYTSMNGLLLSRDGVFAWRCFEERRDERGIRAGYYTLHVHSRDSSVCIASEPVDRKKGWEILPNRSIVQLRNTGGTVVMEHATF